jgi:hypothetical protein
LLGDAIEDDTEKPADSDEEGEEREKVIVRSNGVVTYVGKDIAYQFWKLGLLGRDFKYRVFAKRPHGVLWATSSQNGAGEHPPYGGASYVYNVIDVRQSYLQKLLKQALIAVGHPEGAERSHHFSYEMVGAVSCDGTRARLRATARLGGGEAPVRRGLRAQGARRERRTTCSTRSFRRLVRKSPNAMPNCRKRK